MLIRRGMMVIGALLLASAALVPGPALEVAQAAPPLLVITETDRDSAVVGTSFVYNPKGDGGAFAIGVGSFGEPIESATFPALFGQPAKVDTADPFARVYKWPKGAKVAGTFQILVTFITAPDEIVDFTVVRDTSQPGISILAPVPFATIQNGAVISVNAADSATPIAAIEIRYCRTVGCAWGDAVKLAKAAPPAALPFDFTWNAQPKDGDYAVLARAWDEVGNRTGTVSLTVTIDNTP